jgi:putative hemolysin
MIQELLIVFALILANGFFSGAEMAIVASRKGRLRTLADQGDRRAQAALELAASPDRFLPTVQVGITLVGTLAAAYGGDRLVSTLTTWIADHAPPTIASAARPIALTAFVMLLSFVTLLIGELVPKRLALRRAESFARFAAPLMQRLAWIARPLVWGLGAATSALLRMLGAGAQAEPSVSVDDIHHMLEAGRAEGVLEAVEQAVATEALRLGDRTVRDIMRPRIDVDALDIETPQGEILGAIAMAGYSRLPVYEGSLDHIIGYVSIKDVLRHTWMGWPLELRKMLHRAVFVPETMPLNRLAIVLDEYGGTEGLVTLEDLLEELVGEIHDEHRGTATTFVQRDDGSWLVDGSASVADLAERFGIRLDATPRDYTTISGLVLAELERIPSAGDTLRWQGLTIEVVDMDGRRIDKLLVSRV